MENKYMKDNNLFCCFSIPLRDFLMEHGAKYELCALSPSSMKMMWIFYKDEKVRKLLDEWKSK